MCDVKGFMYWMIIPVFSNLHSILCVLYFYGWNNTSPLRKHPINVSLCLTQVTSCTSRRHWCVRVTKLDCWPLTCGGPRPLSVWSSSTTCTGLAPAYWACSCAAATESRTRCCGDAGGSRASAGWGWWWTTSVMSDTRYVPLANAKEREKTAKINNTQQSRAPSSLSSLNESN